MKEMVLKIFAIIAALAILMSLAGCGKREITAGDATNSQSQTGANVPDNVVPPIGQTTPAEPSGSDLTEPTVSSDADASSDPQSSETEPTATEPQTKTEPVKTEDSTEPVHQEYGTAALKYLTILNSDKVHVKFTEIYSYDGAELLSVEREYFVNGDERIYINDGNKTLIRNGTVTYVDYDAGIYYSYPDDGDYGLNFGYYKGGGSGNCYELLSAEEDDKGLTELYKITGTNTTSSWDFDGNNKLLRVSDRDLDNGSFHLYNFEIIDSSVPTLDFSIPAGFTEVDADDYEFYI